MTAVGGIEASPSGVRLSRFTRRIYREEDVQRRRKAGRAARRLRRRRLAFVTVFRFLPEWCAVFAVTSPRTPLLVLDALATVHRWNRVGVIALAWSHPRVPQLRVTRALNEAFGVRTLDRLHHRSANIHLASRVVLDVCRDPRSELSWTWGMVAGLRGSNYMFSLLIDSYSPPAHLLERAWRAPGVRDVPHLRRKVLNLLLGSSACPERVLVEAANHPDRETRVLVAECSDVPEELRVLAALQERHYFGRG